MKMTTIIQIRASTAIITVTDNGRGLPEDFQLEQTRSLGLQIVRTLVESDLKGKLELCNGVNGDEGLSVNITFPKTIVGG